MSGVSRTTARLMCGALCWLSACSAMAGWTMTSPGGMFTTTFHKNEEVPGYGDAPGAGLNYSFQITEHGLGPVMALSNQATEDIWWDTVCDPPNEATWPVGPANAVLYDEHDLITYRSIHFTH